MKSHPTLLMLFLGCCAIPVLAAAPPPAKPPQPLDTLVISRAGSGAGTVASSDGKINCGNKCSAGYARGSSVSLTATPATGSIFVGWSGALLGNIASTSVTMNGAKSLTATFALTPPQYTLAVTRAGNGSGTVTSSDGKISCGTRCSASYASGSSVSLTATPAAGSVFSGWSGAATGTTAAATVRVSAAANVSATFTSSAAAFNLSQTLSDQAQRTTLAFDGLAMITGNLEAQSFFPPGKVADYTGFQYLRDNDPDNMGHNTSFLTRIANNVLYILTDSQLAQLKALAAAQLDAFNRYGYKRYILMDGFRRVFDGDIPSGSSGLNLNAVKLVSRDLYLLDGQISFDRALLYANIYTSMSATQKAYLDAMKGKGWNSWPNITSDQVRSKLAGLPSGTAVAVMTYASDLFSWYAGSLEADVYFCPERHGTYYGGFYIKDAPAVGHEGYGISEQLTATAGAAMSESARGYVTAAQAALMSGLVATQRNNLYAGSSNIVQVRTDIATLLRSLRTTTASSDAVKARVLALSSTYGDLDGENNYHYATVFAQVYASLSADQKTRLATLRHTILSGTYADGTAFDYTIATTPYLFADRITNLSVLAPYIGNTDYLFFEP